MLIVNIAFAVAIEANWRTRPSAVMHQNRRVACEYVVGVEGVDGEVVGGEGGGVGVGVGGKDCSGLVGGCVELFGWG
jgi:hypothetical protein